MTKGKSIEVNVSELKTHLSRYLKRVKAGEQVVVMDRSTPVAKLSPLYRHDEQSAEKRFQQLIDEGVVRPAKAKLPKNFFRSLPKSSSSVVQGLLEERDESR